MAWKASRSADDVCEPDNFCESIVVFHILLPSPSHCAVTLSIVTGLKSDVCGKTDVPRVVVYQRTNM